MKKLLSFLTAALLATLAWSAEIPKVFSIRCGDIETSFQKRSFWNMQGVKFKGKTVSRPNSWYGTVTGGQDNLKGWIGSGHMENGIGEKNLKISFKLDGKPWTPVAGLTSAGEFELVKESDIGHMHLKYQLRISGNKIYEHVWTNMNKRSMILIYHFMFAWDTTFTEYAVTDLSGAVSSGKFLGNKANTYIPMPKKFGVYAPAIQTAAIAEITPASRMGKDEELRLHDLSSFRKYYFVPTTRSRKRLYPGKVFEYSQTTAFYQCDAKSFMQKMAKSK